MGIFMDMSEDGWIHQREFLDNGTARIGRWPPDDPSYAQIKAEYEAWLAVEKTQIPAPTGPFTAPYTYPVEGLPEGTKAIIILTDGTAMPVLELDQDLIFTAPGKYHLIIDPPLPYLGFGIDLNVTQ
jgi:hypothetical protein